MNRSWSIPLAGCTASNLCTNIYLLSLSYINASTSLKIDPLQVNPNISTTFSAISGIRNGSTLEVRVGYMGLCISQNIGPWVCSNSEKTLANLIKEGSSYIEASASGIDDPLNLIWIAGKFRHQIVFDGLIYAAIPLSFITILLLATFPGWHEDVDEDSSEREVKPFPSRPVSQAALIMISLASLLSFVSILWQHVAASAAASMVQSLSYGTVKGHVGAAAMILGWGAVLLCFLVAVGLLIMILSIKVLSETFG